MENQNNDFSNVIWTDETTVQLENHRRFSHRKCGEKPRPKPKYIYHLTFMYECIIWTYIHVTLSMYVRIYIICTTVLIILFLCIFHTKTSCENICLGWYMNGHTDLVMFDGIMDAQLYVRILRAALIPSARRLYPDGNYFFMQDNDPKHTSRWNSGWNSGNSLLTMGLSGGRHHQSLPILIPLRISGMNIERSSQKTKLIFLRNFGEKLVDKSVRNTLDT